MSWLDADMLTSLRNSEPDTYAASFFFPAAHRQALLTVLAFHVELVKIPDMVSEPMLGEIRLQWWRDALATGEASTGNPMADALLRVIQDYKLPMKSFQEMIDARSFDLSNELFRDISALKVHFRKTNGAYFHLASQMGSNGDDKPDQELIHSAALAYGGARLLQDLPMSVSRGRLYVPQSLVDEHGVDLEAVWRGETSPALVHALEEIETITISAYNSFKSRIKKLTPSKFSPAFLPVTLVKQVISKTKSGDHQPLRDYSPSNPLMRLWRYWLAAAWRAY